MKKTLLALAILGITGMAQAQSNITLYGILDTGFVKEGGASAGMADNETSTLGFRGTEDLGGGLKATFEVARQFMAHDGTKQAYFLDDKIHQATDQRSAVDWQNANVGLAGEWGSVRFGRISDIAVEYYAPFDPFEQGTTASTISKYSRLRSEQQSNTARYDSPEWHGITFSGSFTLRADDAEKATYGDIYNQGFAGALRYEQGPLMLAATYSRQADSNNSYVWNAGAAYKFGPARISVGFQQSRLKDMKGLADPTINTANAEDFEAMKQREWLVGLTYDIGPGTFRLSYNRGKVTGREPVGADNANGSTDKYAMGYVYPLSKRTYLHAEVSYTDSENKYVGSVYNNNGAEKASMAGVQVGMTHHF